MNHQTLEVHRALIALSNDTALLDTFDTLVYGPEKRRASGIIEVANLKDVAKMRKVRGDAPMEEENRTNYFQWDCCDDSPEIQTFLEEALPSDYNYQIIKMNLIEESSVWGETKFSTIFNVDICSKEGTENFIKSLETKTGTQIIQNRKEATAAGDRWKSRSFHCVRKVRDQKASNIEQKTGKGTGSGRKTGQERQKGKGTNCNAKFSYKLYPCDKNQQSGLGHQCYKLNIKLDYNHNHEINSTDSWNFLNVRQETIDRYEELFVLGYTPSKARLVFISELKAKYGEQGFFQISSNRSINPDRGFVFNLCTSYYKRKVGTVNGPDTYLKAVEFIEKVNEKAGEVIASIRQLPCGTVVVAVCDALMKRGHQHIPASADVMFVDATGSLDLGNHQVKINNS